MFSPLWGIRPIRVVIGVDTPNVNLLTLCGSPIIPVNITIVINPGVQVYSNLASSPALTTGDGWNPLSKVTLINQGLIVGMGGAGGRAALGKDSLNVTPGAGGTGGDAIQLLFPLSVNNIGEVFAGGGGGGGGGGNEAGDSEDPKSGFISVRGGGGGGGRGRAPSAGGAGGSNPGVGSASNSPGATGGSGTTSSAGAGGAGGWVNYPVGCTAFGGTGGAGGDYGAAGSAGGAGFGCSDPGDEGPGAGGGAAGFAVRLNGFVITWLAGNNGTQVKGSQG